MNFCQAQYDVGIALAKQKILIFNMESQLQKAHNRDCCCPHFQTDGVSGIPLLWSYIEKIETNGLLLMCTFVLGSPPVAQSHTEIKF